MVRRAFAIVVAAACGDNAHAIDATSGPVLRMHQIAYVKAPDSHAGLFFASRIALAADGSRAAMMGSGEVYVLVRDGARWMFEAEIASSPSANKPGDGIALSADGATLAFGRTNDGSNAGGAYVYTRDGTTWTQTGHVQRAAPTPSDFFGTSVVLSGDGRPAPVRPTCSHATAPHGSRWRT
jgi:hypothetical protein